MLSAEREKEIRYKSERWGHPDYGTCLFAGEFIPELLSEIDRLRKENARLSEFYNKIRGTDKDHQVKLEKIAFDFEEKLHFAVKALDEIFENSEVENGICAGCALIAQKALKQIRGEK